MKYTITDTFKIIGEPEAGTLLLIEHGSRLLITRDELALVEKSIAHFRKRIKEYEKNKNRVSDLPTGNDENS